MNGIRSIDSGRCGRQGALVMPGRRGAVLVAAIVCLAVILLVSAALVRSLTIQHRQIRYEELREQSFWLAESAVGRAAARLRADPAYRGEVWAVQSVQPEGMQRGSVQIDVEPVADRPNQRRVRIAAVWPDDPLRRSLSQRELVIQLPGGGDSS